MLVLYLILKKQNKNKTKIKNQIFIINFKILLNIIYLVDKAEGKERSLPGSGVRRGRKLF